MLALPVGQVFNQWLTSWSGSPTVTYVTEPSDEKQKAFTQMATGSEGEVAFITGVATGSTSAAIFGGRITSGNVIGSEDLQR